MKKASKFTYTVSGQDGANEGPFDLEEMKRRIADGRVTGATFVQRSDVTHWSTASDFEELSVKDVVVSRYDNETLKIDPLEQEIADSRFRRAVRSGAGWFFWIAALSAFNSIAARVGSEGGFALGLSVVYPIGQAGELFGKLGITVAFGLNITLGLLYLFFGVASWKKYFTPYIVGMALFAGDTALALLAGDIVSTIIHILGLYWMFRGLDAHMERGGREWNMRFILPYAATALLVAGGGYGLITFSKPAAQKLTPETWAAKPKTEWPQLVLTHDSEFRGHSALQGASAFLVELPSKRVIAATAKHLLGADGGVTPTLRVAEVDKAIVNWKLHPRDQPDSSVAVTGLFGSADFYGTFQDWLLLDVDNNNTAKYPAVPLKFRQELPHSGETVYIVGARYENDKQTQEVLTGKITNPADGIIEGTLAIPANLEGFSGAPVVDAQGHVVGVLTGTRSNADKDGRYATFAGHGVEEIQRLLRVSSGEAPALAKR